MTEKIHKKEKERADALIEKIEELFDIKDDDDLEILAHHMIGIIGATGMVWDSDKVVGMLFRCAVEVATVASLGGDGDE